MTSKAGMNVNEVLVQELHKPVIKKLKRRKVYSRFKDNLWAEDLAEMGLLTSFNHGIQYLLCVIDVFTKYACVKPLMNRKAKAFLDGFIGVANTSKRKPNSLWIDQGREFYKTFAKMVRL